MEMEEFGQYLVAVVVTIITVIPWIVGIVGVASIIHFVINHVRIV